MTLRGSSRCGVSGSRGCAQGLDAIRQAILDFRLTPGPRVIERQLIEQTGVWRATPPRGDATARGGSCARGRIVVIPAAQEAAELYEVPAAVEALAARRFVRHTSDRQLPSCASRLPGSSEIAAACEHQIHGTACAGLGILVCVDEEAADSLALATVGGLGSSLRSVMVLGSGPIVSTGDGAESHRGGDE